MVHSCYLCGDKHAMNIAAGCPACREWYIVAIFAAKPNEEKSAITYECNSVWA